MKVFVGDLFEWKSEDAKNMYIIADSREFTLIVEKTRDVKKDGVVIGTETYQADPLHFSKLHSVINHLITMRVKESEAGTLKELLQEMKEIRHTVEVALLI